LQSKYAKITNTLFLASKKEFVIFVHLLRHNSNDNQEFVEKIMLPESEKQLCVPSVKTLSEAPPPPPPPPSIECPQPQGFDVLPDGTIPTGSFLEPRQYTTEWEACGIARLTSTDPGGPLIFDFALTGKSPPNHLAGCKEFVTAPAPSCKSGLFFEPIGVEFTDPVSSASIKALGVGCRGLILDGYDSVDSLVDSASVIHPVGSDPSGGSGADRVDTLSISGPGIVRLDIHQILPTFKCGSGVLDGYAIDDLGYTFEP